MTECGYYRRPDGVMGGPCTNCGMSQPEHAIPSEGQEADMAKVLKFAPSRVHEADLPGESTIVIESEPIQLPLLHNTPSTPNVRVMSISELITACNEAGAKMSNSNDHRHLVMNCAWAMRQLVDRLDAYESKAGGS